MKVKAIKPCFLGGRLQQPGDIFDFPGDKPPEHLVTIVDDVVDVTKPVKRQQDDGFPPSGGFKAPKVISDDARDVEATVDDVAPKAVKTAKTAAKAAKAAKPAAKAKAAKSKAK